MQVISHCRQAGRQADRQTESSGYGLACVRSTYMNLDTCLLSLAPICSSLMQARLDVYWSSMMNGAVGRVLNQGSNKTKCSVELTLSR